MDVRRAEQAVWRPSGDERFTGEVWNTRLHEGGDGPTVIAVLFAPGARSHWHSHPEGQVLYVLSGSGLVQTGDGPVEEIGPGDMVVAPPGELHWHGAGPDGPMIHLSLTTGGPTQWEGEVVDEEYRRRRPHPDG